MSHPPTRKDTQSSHISKMSRRSDESYTSQSTAPTSVTESPVQSPRPSLHQTKSTPKYCATTYDDEHHYQRYHDERSSYASSDFSSHIYEEPEEYWDSQYTLPPPSIPEIESIATTPQDFATYFPSQRRLNIHHDETSEDGNMNLRIDTEILEGARKINMQLFHLRMHELATRQFSLRRYCRDSGREVCHSIAKAPKPASQRPGLPRSMTAALANIRSMPAVKRTNSWGSTKSGKSTKSTRPDFSPERHDSGYASNSEDEDDFVSADEESVDIKIKPAQPSHTTKFEFSNYAQVDVKRAGSKTTKRWEFEYWGSTYAWKRVASKDAEMGMTRYSYHLVKNDANNPVAHIVPEPRTLAQVREEELAGGWVPRCSLWISDTGVLGQGDDVADVIVATGLVALVEDSYKRHFTLASHKPKFTRQISLPLTPLKMDMEFVGPKALAKHVFGRRASQDKGEKSRPSTRGSIRDRTYSRDGAAMPSPLRLHSAVAAR